MTFQTVGFQNSGYQVDEELVVGRARPRRNYYEIRGKLYLLSNEELEYLVHKILAEDELPKAKKERSTADE